jgi:hypothetical protein
MEDSMCWETDYWFIAEQEKAKKAKASEEQHAGLIKNLLNQANKEAEKSDPEAAPVNEVMPAK